VVRAKARLLQTLLTELEPAVTAVGAYRQAVEDFFAALPCGAVDLASSAIPIVSWTRCNRESC
jgi:hypothetical protein